MSLDIYPAIDIKGGKCVRLVQGRFDDVTTYGDDPTAMALHWKSLGAQWVHVVDLDGARSGADASGNFTIVCDIVKETGLPIQFGGGVRNADIVARMLDAGVQRVVLGTAAARNPDFAREMFELYGSRIAVGVDAREGFVAVHGWQESSGEKATDFVIRMAALGAPRFIFTDISRDGMLIGINTESLTEVASAVQHVPVIASGGVAALGDLTALTALQTRVANIDGVIVGKALYTGAVTLPDLLKKSNNST